jgi:exocyst complex protein 7
MSRVDHSLTTFQSGLLGVEREMLPIYKLTEKLRETQKNIDLCVQELRCVNENFVAAQAVRLCGERRANAIACGLSATNCM